MSEPEEAHKQEAIPYYRILGLILQDFFRETPFSVEVEKDMSVQQQRLDLLVIRKGEGELPLPLPDGFAPLAKHNLLSFKSFQDTLDADAMDELLGHYVAYRKLVSPRANRKALLPAEEFRLIAVSARFPEGLAKQGKFTQVQEGVYDCPWGSKLVRLVVLNRLPQEGHNALLHLFTAQPELVEYGRTHYKPRFEDTSSVVDVLLNRYREEGIPMPYTMDDFKRDVKAYLFQRLTPAEIIKELTPAEIIEELTPAEIIKELTPEQRLKGMSAEELFAALPPETRDTLVRKLKADEPPSKAD